METIIAPSVLSADFARLGQDVEDVLAAGADWVHFDVMDNHFVPNLTVGPMVCQALRDYGISAPLDVHLMVQPVDAIIKDFANAGATSISFHPEASIHVDRTISIIREHGCSPGIAINPATSLSCIDYLIEQVDMILLMSVNPGFGGQKFIPYVFDKIVEVADIVDEIDNDVRIQVDGGVNAENIGDLAAAGADTFVAGSAIFGTADYKAAIDAMKASIAAATEFGNRI